MCEGSKGLSRDVLVGFNGGGLWCGLLLLVKNLPIFLSWQMALPPALTESPWSRPSAEVEVAPDLAAREVAPAKGAAGAAVPAVTIPPLRRLLLMPRRLPLLRLLLLRLLRRLLLKRRLLSGLLLLLRKLLLLASC